MSRKRQRCAAGEIGEIEGRLAGTPELVRGADAVEIGERLAIAREEQMVAVVDGHAEGGIDVGAAAPAGMLGRFMEHEIGARRVEPYRGGKPGEAGADDMNAAARHQKMPWRSRIQISMGRPTRTRSRGALKPRATSPSRMRR